MTRRAWAGVGVFGVLLSVTLAADTLILRDGRRVEGRLLSVRDGVIEFEARRSVFGRERLRLSQSEVARIDFDEDDDRPGNDLSGGRPSGMRERDVTVSAQQPWSDSGVNVRSGQQVYFSASGRVRWGPGRQDGPAGERDSPRNESRPIPSRPAAALIGRVGEGENYFFIGDEATAIRIRDSGRLYLGINDDFLQDNSGSFRVTVYY